MEFGNDLSYVLSRISGTDTCLIKVIKKVVELEEEIKKLKEELKK